MTTGEVIQRIQSLYSKGVASDETRLMSRHIYNKLLTVRSRLISQEAKKKQEISQWNYQLLPCVELEVVPEHLCPCIPPTSCSILRSKYKLPKPLSGLSGTLINSVSTIGMINRVKLDEIKINAVKFLKGNKYTSRKINYFIQDGYIYVIATNSLKVISVVGLFEDPIEVSNFKNLCSQEDCKDCGKCKDYSEEIFPIDSDMIDTMIELSLTELLQIFSQGSEDKTNNSSDNTKLQAK